MRDQLLVGCPVSWETIRHGELTDLTKQFCSAIGDRFPNVPYVLAMRDSDNEVLAHHGDKLLIAYRMRDLAE